MTIFTFNEFTFNGEYLFTITEARPRPVLHLSSEKDLFTYEVIVFTYINNFITFNGFTFKVGYFGIDPFFSNLRAEKIYPILVPVVT